MKAIFGLAAKRLSFIGVAALVASVMTGCGGGGGDGDNSTGLVPAPPALGATLFADATDVRPLVAGASWRYDGTDPNGAAYSNTVTHTAAPTGVIESSTNEFAQGPSDLHVAVVNGNIVQPDAIDVDGDSVNDIANVIELRTPIRVNDQITVFDQRIPGVLPDIDGDGRMEALDLAMYSRVIGLENVVLASGTISAVRVDHFVLGRLVASRDGYKFPTVTLKQSVWYSESLGIVRQRLDSPADDGISRDVSDEKLVDVSGL